MKVLASGLKGTIGRNIDNFEGYSGDIRDLSLYSQLANFDSFLHLAGVVGVNKVLNSITASYEINVTATLKLAEECINRDYKQFIFVSTSHIYDLSTNKISENANLNPRTVYAKQKLETEESLKTLFSNKYTKLVVVRLFSILGEGMPEFTLGGLLDQIATHGERQVSFSEDQRDFLSPSQAAKGLEMIARYYWKKNETFNLCTGQSLSVKEASKIYLHSRGFIVNENIYRAESSAAPKIIGDNSKLKERLPDIASIINVFNPSMNES